MRILLETERLRLREVTTDDLDDLARLEEDPEVMRYIGKGRPSSFEEVRQKLDKAIQYSSQHAGLGMWIIEKKDGTFIGSGCLKHLDKTDEIEMGYYLLKEHWGKGFATETAKALVEYGLEQLGLPRVVATTHPENRASIRVLEKVGLSFGGTGTWYGLNNNHYSIERPLEKGSQAEGARQREPVGKR